MARKPLPAVPDAAEVIRRDATYRKIAAAVNALYPKARVEVFGSGATGLALKDADIDLVALGVGPQGTAKGGGASKVDKEAVVRVLRKIEKALQRSKVAWKACVIPAKVPIVKMNVGTHAVDLSVGAANGLAAVGWIRQQVASLAALRPLVLVLKRLLKTHRLDDASTGGCGGYLLVSLVVSHLRQCGAAGSASNPDTGTLLLGFLRRFGRDFDYGRVAVAAGRASGVLRATEVVVHGRRPMVLAEDPQVGAAACACDGTHCVA